MVEKDLQKVLSWRNHPKVRAYMYTQHEISIKEHALWFERASNDAQRHILIYEKDGVPMGFINIHETVDEGVANWGFYVAPDSQKGTGRALGIEALRFAFNSIGLKKVCGQVLAFNERSIIYHLNLGFHRENIMKQQYFDGKSFHDVICLGLFASDWLLKCNTKP
jgi:UDP-4-amino-4,6-dideoxy-N-acetyl-beta-L-altrosamine N-acetyltransferase